MNGNLLITMTKTEGALALDGLLSLLESDADAESGYGVDFKPGERQALYDLAQALGEATGAAQ